MTHVLIRYPSYPCFTSHVPDAECNRLRKVGTHDDEDTNLSLVVRETPVNVH